MTSSVNQNAVAILPSQETEDEDGFARAPEPASEAECVRVAVMFVILRFELLIAVRG